jgi:hypothetical protein
VPAGYTLDSYLRERAEAGLSARYPEPSAEVRARLEHELEIIRDMSFSGYFLVVWDFIHFAKQRGIAVGPGRDLRPGVSLGPRRVDRSQRGAGLSGVADPDRRAVRRWRADRHGHSAGG